MIEKKVIVGLQSGLHARSAAIFVQEANKFTSELFLKKNDKKVNARSIMSVMSLVLTKGSEITVMAKGEDEESAIEALIEFLSQENL